MRGRVFHHAEPVLRLDHDRHSHCGLQIKRGEALEFSLVRGGCHPRADLHDDEAMGAGIFVFVQTAGILGK